MERDLDIFPLVVGHESERRKRKRLPTREPDFRMATRTVRSNQERARRKSAASDDVARRGGFKNESARPPETMGAQKRPMAIRVSVAASGAAHREVRDLRQALRRTQGR